MESQDTFWNHFFLRVWSETTSMPFKTKALRCLGITQSVKHIAGLGSILVYSVQSFALYCRSAGVFVFWFEWEKKLQPLRTS